MNRISTFSMLFVVCLFASNSFGATVDGTVEAADGYTSVLTDADGESGYEDGLNIDEFHYHNDGSSYYLGLTVEGGADFDKDGSDHSFFRMTSIGMAFYADASAATPTVTITLMFNAAGFDDSLSFIREWDANTLQWVETDFDDPGVPANYTIAPSGPGATTAMELELNHNLFQNTLPSYLRLQLDDTGYDADDQIEGSLPEPMTMTILGLGGIGVLLRRRRK